MIPRKQRFLECEIELTLVATASNIQIVDTGFSTRLMFEKPIFDQWYCG